MNAFCSSKSGQDVIKIQHQSLWDGEVWMKPGPSRFGTEIPSSPSGASFINGCWGAPAAARPAHLLTARGSSPACPWAQDLLAITASLSSLTPAAHSGAGDGGSLVYCQRRRIPQAGLHAAAASPSQRPPLCSWRAACCGDPMDGACTERARGRRTKQDGTEGRKRHLQFCLKCFPANVHV